MIGSLAISIVTTGLSEEVRMNTMRWDDLRMMDGE